MSTLLSEHKPKARKDYFCDASRFIRDANCFDRFSFTEKRIIVRARSNGYRIKKGEQYIKQFVVEGGDNWTFRAIPELHAICIKYDLYPE